MLSYLSNTVNYTAGVGGGAEQGSSGLENEKHDVVYGRAESEMNGERFTQRAQQNLLSKTSPGKKLTKDCLHVLQ